MNHQIILYLLYYNVNYLYIYYYYICKLIVGNSIDSTLHKHNIINYTPI